MRTRKRCLGLVLAGGVALATDPIPVKLGQFEITLTMNMGGEDMSSTRARCILPADGSSVERTVKGAPGKSKIVGKRVGDCKK